LDPQRLEALLEGIRDGKVDVAQGLRDLGAMPFAEVGDGQVHTRVDTHRALRCGFPEVIFGQGKQPSELVEIARELLKHHGKLLVTRVSREGSAALMAAIPGAKEHAVARAVTVGEPATDSGAGGVLVVSAGTSDGPVAAEALLTARMLGANTEMLADVGVAGIQRLLSHTEKLRSARVVVVVAGMEGALASVVGGLIERPLIAVPTSIGYGASFQGVTPLLAMLNSCAAGVTVVNIDNGFGAGYAAAQINSLEPLS
jgi:NCAIR mutase (PurE)-related protein